MNMFLESVPLLYLLFFATIIHLGYFILLKENRSIIIFCLVSIFIYLVIPNMVVVLAISLIFVDMLYIVNSSYNLLNEGFTGSLTIKDLSGVDISANKFIQDSMNSMNITPPPPSDISYNFGTNFGTNFSNSVGNGIENSYGNRLGEIDDQSKKMKNDIEKIKSVYPEIMDSLKVLNSIDITELNKLMNNMSKISKTITP